ncbi:MAG TPA: hypothetical protein VHG93_18510, partial [Longimicrobium sp.]|nr:hypothetical protein [Longimicrobium sp.]
MSRFLSRRNKILHEASPRGASFEMTAHGTDFVRATKSAMNLYFRFFVDLVAGKQTRRRTVIS